MATLIQITNLYKSYGPHVILNGANLAIAEKQKIGVVGRNGAGKSTLFKIIIGEEEKDSGDVVIHDRTKLGYLTQHDPYEPSEIIMDYLKRSSGKEDWQCAKLAGAFQLKNDLLTKPIGSLAGGYQMRVKLTSILLREPNLLLLDEPTNYLDLSTLILLEEWLKRYRGSYLIISHDREFLKNTCTETLEIDQGKISLYPRPLEEYLAYKEEQISMVEKHNKKIEREKKHLQTFVDRFRYKDSKASQAQSKLKQIARLKTIDIVHPLRTARIRIPRVEDRKGTALTIKDLVIGYSDKIVANDITLHVERGEHVAIVGDNGQGKTTFLKTIAGELSQLGGTFRFGPHITIGYYAQHVPSMLLPHEQVGTYLKRVAPPGTKPEEILRMAGNFLFHDDDVKKSISVLSGGEKARLCLAGLLLQKNSVLLLDEPTNHLDFETVEALASALQESNSTILFISHNRTFVSVLADSIIEVGNGKVRRYPHNYDEYVYHLSQMLEIPDPSSLIAAPGKAGLSPASLPGGQPGSPRYRSCEAGRARSTEPVVSTTLSAEERKERRAEIKKCRKELQEIEYEIMELEKEKEKLLNWFQKNPTDFSREKNEKFTDLQKIITEKEKEWMEKQEDITETE